MRGAWLATVLVGCAYPEFAFAPDAAVDSAEPPVVVDSSEPAEASCSAIRAKLGTAESGVFRIDPDGDGPLAAFAVFCEMSADDGGWTLALKADGAKTTFAYDSPLWTNDEVLNPSSTDLSTAEAKFRSFGEVPFTQLRAAMFDGSTMRSLVLDRPGSSLRALFAGPAVTTNAGRAKWLSLIADASLQALCNAEGVNQEFISGNKLRIRLGIGGNEQDHCQTVNSFIGFGVTFGDTAPCFFGVDPGVVVGNAARTTCEAPADRSTQTVGYLFVR